MLSSPIRDDCEISVLIPKKRVFPLFLLCLVLCWLLVMLKRALKSPACQVAKVVVHVLILRPTDSELGAD